MNESLTKKPYQLDGLLARNLAKFVERVAVETAILEYTSRPLPAIKCWLINGIRQGLVKNLRGRAGGNQQLPDPLSGCSKGKYRLENAGRDVRYFCPSRAGSPRCVEIATFQSPKNRSGWEKPESHKSLPHGRHLKNVD
ncbi:hypothetical protein LCG56_20265 [Pseudomonas cannabina pv. alisalensis]|uniref:Uncharacterized protein n=1 Tax=Pseudomonas syringae pv. maculicola str. ES4326 TaxID=629265 RepID=A0A8T8BWE9_PSEYM|nr:MULTISPECIES: hypothetical protein [Pseudomonas syringae group]QHE95671.1 hypothetical protein PMA4326_002855 [Pseudomonas syringae pv. maculicola str. ES4326]UBY96302.1 hypothetical protein LCG56_20265 [Pseudomonas cannabina pv. alisalensis]